MSSEESVVRVNLIVLTVLAAASPRGLHAESGPLWLTSAGKQPPRLYLFWQSGWTPFRSPKHLNLVEPKPPDLFQYVASLTVSPPRHSLPG